MTRCASGNKWGMHKRGRREYIASSERPGSRFQPRSSTLRHTFSLLAFLLAISLEAQAKASFCSETLPASVHLSNETEQPSGELLARLRVLMRQFPADLAIARAYQQVVIARGIKSELSEMIEWYQHAATSSLNDRQAQYLYARSLVDVDTPKALGILQHDPSSNHNYPWYQLGLATLYDTGRYLDEAKLRKSLEAFLNACPHTLDTEAWTLLLHHPRTVSDIPYAQALQRNLLEQGAAGSVYNLWALLWDLMFKVTPPEHHQAVRTAISNDVRALQKYPPSLANLTAIQKGEELVGDRSAEKTTAARIMELYPGSEQGCADARRLFAEKHPFPQQDATLEEQLTFFRDLLHYTEIKGHECNSWILWRDQLEALRRLPEATGKQLALGGKNYISAYHTDGTLFFWPPPEFSVADLYVAKRMNLSLVPQLIRDGQAQNALLRTASDRSMTSDSENDHQLALDIEAAEILTALAQQTGDSGEASNSVEALQNAVSTNLYREFTLWRLRAHFAEVSGRRLDALALYQVAKHLAPLNDQADKQLMSAAEARLWKELGGTDAGRQAWSQGTGQSLAVGSDAWTVPALSMPPWSLVDLTGHPWNLKDLEGKVL